MGPRIRSLLLGTAVAAGFALGPALAAEEKVVNVYNWSDYIGEHTIADFEKETGIKVRYDVYDSNETLEAKLFAGKSGYDVVSPSSGFLGRQIKAGIYQKLDKSKMPNLAGLDPELMKRLEPVDPGNQYATIYAWGTVGLGLNIDKIKQRMPDAPIDSLDLIFKPENAMAFINYTLKPEVEAAFTDFVKYPNAVSASIPLIDKDITADKSIYPPPEIMAKLFPDEIASPALDRLRTRAWTRIKTGK